jgi:hypothetical protein
MRSRSTIEACRAVALRLHARGIDSFSVRRTWPEGLPTFIDIVASEG